MFSKHVVLNMDNIRQERLSEGTALNLNKIHEKKKFGTHVKESMAFKDLKK